MSRTETPAPQPDNFPVETAQPDLLFDEVDQGLVALYLVALGPVVLSDMVRLQPLVRGRDGDRKIRFELRLKLELNLVFDDKAAG